MNLTILTQPAYEPVSLEQVAEFLRLGPLLTDAEEELLTRHIVTARRDVERITRRSLVRQQLRLSADCFDRLYLLRPPLVSVASVEYYDADRALQALAADSWYVTDDLVPELVLVDGVSPTTFARRDAVRITYWAGYPADGSPGTSEEELIANVPSEAKDAILVGVQLLHDRLDPVERERLERAREALLSGMKVYGVA